MPITQQSIKPFESPRVIFASSLPSLGSGSYRFMPAFDVHFGLLHMEYDTVLEMALIMVGFGLSLWALPRGLLWAALCPGEVRR